MFVLESGLIDSMLVKSMKIGLATLLLIVLGMIALVRADDPQLPSSLDPLCFLAGVSIFGQERGYLHPPQCESFFKSGGERRAAEVFLAAAQVWSKRSRDSDYPTKYYYQEDGQRFVVENPILAEDLRRFYDPATKTAGAKLGYFFNGDADRDQRLAFVAGVYVRCFKDGAFHGFPSPALRDVIIILLAEGCEVSDLTLEGGVPNGMHFKVKPSERVARIFTAIDKWQPAPVDWKPID